MGRSDTRESLRRHFEIDSECIVVASLYSLHKQGKLDAESVSEAIHTFDIDPEKIDPYFA